MKSLSSDRPKPSTKKLPENSADMLPPLLPGYEWRVHDEWIFGFSGTKKQFSQQPIAKPTTGDEMKLSKKLIQQICQRLSEPKEGYEFEVQVSGQDDHNQLRFVEVPIIQVISPSDILSSVDVELSSAPEQDDWHVFGGGSVLLNQNLKYSPFRMNLKFSSARIRQDHTFGHRGGDQPVPNGILVEFSGTFKRKEWCSFEGDAKNITWTDIIGSYTVLGTCDGYRYEHEDKS